MVARLISVTPVSQSTSYRSVTQEPFMIPFNRPFLTGNELLLYRRSARPRALAGDGQFTPSVVMTGCKRRRVPRGVADAFLHGRARDDRALLSEIAPGDEVIMPAYTFVSTANAFCLRGVYQSSSTSGVTHSTIDETLIESAITRAHSRDLCRAITRALAARWTRSWRLRSTHGLIVIEDAAQGVQAQYGGKPLGTFGALGAFSFHETKNIIAGEGGALLINDAGTSSAPR